MKRAAALLFLFCASLLLSSPLEAKEIRLRFANFPAAATFPCIAMERWAAEVHKRTAGAVRVETFPGGTLLDAKNMVRGVTQGQADIGCISLAYHPGAYPFLSVFELPLGFASSEAISAVMWDIHAAHRPKETSKVKVISLFGSAPAQIMSTKPVRSAADLKGLKLRAAGTLADIAAGFGALPESMPQSDTPEALQKGLVQGVFSSFDVLQDYNFAESCRYGLVVDMPVYPFMVFMNMKTWESLPADVQKVVMDLAREHSVWTGKYVDQHGKDATAWSTRTYNFSLAELSAEEKAALRQTVSPVIEAWKERSESKGVKAGALLEDVLRAKAEAEKE